MKELKQILTEIVNHLETIATNQGAMEAALAAQGIVHSGDIDTHTGVLSGPRTSAKHALVNVRHQISQLPE